MNMKKFLFLSLIVLGLFSCKDDTKTLNNEADILSATLNGVSLERETQLTNTAVVFTVDKSVDRTQLAPMFTLSPGATISPSSETVRDFTNPQEYTVTSENKEWKKTYRVEVQTIGNTTRLLKYDFEDVEQPIQQQNFQSFIEVEGTDTLRIWASGNAGFGITNAGAAYDAFPTYQGSEGRTGKCATLVTRSTGSMGAMFKSPIAAGNLFLGSFEIDITNTLKSTHFGMPFNQKPTVVKGYYKYKSGPEYKEYTNAAGEYIKDGVVVNKKDSCNIYAVMYESTSEVPHLDGTNVKTSDVIVGIADMGNGAEAADWTAFELPFVWNANFDPVKLAHGDYNMTLVFSSSMHGDLFNGALGSTLSVDDVQIEIEVK